MRGYWSGPAPDASPAHELAHAEWVNNVDKIVCSTTLDAAGWNNTRAHQLRHVAAGAGAEGGTRWHDDDLRQPEAGALVRRYGPDRRIPDRRASGRRRRRHAAVPRQDQNSSWIWSNRSRSTSRCGLRPLPGRVKGSRTMRSMVLIQLDPALAPEGGPDEALAEAMGELIEEMTKAGVLLDTAGSGARRSRRGSGSPRVCRPWSTDRSPSPRRSSADTVCCRPARRGGGRVGLTLLRIHGPQWRSASRCGRSTSPREGGHDPISTRRAWSSRG